MTIDEAIEILSILESRSINNSKMFKKDALKLGIEALKRVIDSRRLDPKWPDELLPGETKESRKEVVQ